jgi:hypothetical protein
MKRLRCFLLALTGCNAVFDVRDTRVVDAEIPSDRDADGVIDIIDNCPDVPNTDQDDGDGDQTGDACDDCPLLANAQDVDRDDDGLGDACDPHPAAAGDCLVLFDTFSDPDRFFDGWDVSTTNPTPMVTPRAGDVVLHYQPGFNLGILAKGTPGLLDIAVKATSPTGNATVIAAAGVSSGTMGYWCSLQEPNNTVVVYGPSCPSIFGSVIPPVTGAPDAFVHLFIEDAGASVTTSCRADHGFSIGTAVVKGCGRITGGGAGVIVAGEDVTVEAVAIVRTQPGQPCPEPIRR